MESEIKRLVEKFYVSNEDLIVNKLVPGLSFVNYIAYAYYLTTTPSKLGVFSPLKEVVVNVARLQSLVGMSLYASRVSDYPGRTPFTQFVCCLGTSHAALEFTRLMGITLNSWVPSVLIRRCLGIAFPVGFLLYGRTFIGSHRKQKLADRVHHVLTTTVNSASVNRGP